MFFDRVRELIDLSVTNLFTLRSYYLLILIITYITYITYVNSINVLTIVNN